MRSNRGGCAKSRRLYAFLHVPTPRRQKFVVVGGVLFGGSRRSHPCVFWLAISYLRTSACEELGIGFVPWSPLGCGYFTGTVSPSYQFAKDTDLRAQFPRFTPEARRDNWPLVELVQHVADRQGATPGQVAPAWLLAQRPWIVPIPGTTNIEHLEENIAAADIELTPDDLTEIEDGFARIGARGSA
jgi:aryl-alcohol dehydrogenase-like predicted oxidoreductase